MEFSFPLFFVRPLKRNCGKKENEECSIENVLQIG